MRILGMCSMTVRLRRANGTVSTRLRWILNPRRVVALWVLVLGLCACGSESGTGPPPPPPPPGGLTLSGAVQPIFTSNCAFAAGCHAGPNAQEGMDLSEGQAFTSIVNMASGQVPRLFRVAPSDPDSSYVVIKLEDKAGQVGGTPTQMPLGGQLTQAQIDTIRGWIAAGAQNN